MLTVVHSLDSGEFFVSLLHHFGELPEELRTIGTGDFETPCRVESLLRCIDSEVDILFGGLRDLGDQFAVGCQERKTMRARSRQTSSDQLTGVDDTEIR